MALEVNGRGARHEARVEVDAEARESAREWEGVGQKWKRDCVEGEEGGIETHLHQTHATCP